MYEFLKEYCANNAKFFGSNYKIKEIPTENGAGYVITYGPSYNPSAASMIISDKATLGDLNSVVELEPATGAWVDGKAQPTTGDKTYAQYLAQINKGDFSHVPSNAVISIPTTYQAQYDKSLDVACGIVKSAGNDVLNIGELGFSGSGEASLRSAANSILSNKYPNATYRCTNFDAYIQEAYVMNSANYSDADREKIIGRMEVVNFIPDAKAAQHNIGSWRYVHKSVTNNGMRSVYYSLKGLEKQGYNSSIYEVNFDEKMYYSQYQHARYLPLGLYGTNTLDYLAGNADTITNVSSEYGVIGYKRRLNLETGEYEIVPVEAEITHEFEPSKLDGFVIKEYDSDKIKKYRNLKNIGDVNISYLSDSSKKASLNNGETIVSELKFVQDSMNAIRNEVKQQSFLTAFKGMSFRSTSGIPGALVGVIEQAFSAIGMLMDSLVSETESVISFAEAYADMDVDLGNVAGRIVEDIPIDEPTVTPSTYSGGGGYYYGGGSSSGGGSSGDGTVSPKEEDEKTTPEETPTTPVTPSEESQPVEVTPQQINNEVDINNVPSTQPVSEEGEADTSLDDLPLEDEIVDDVPEEVITPDVTPTPTPMPTPSNQKKGKHVAGTIAGIAAVGLGAAGVAYGVKKMKENNDSDEFSASDEDNGDFEIHESDEV